jgi:hypothetical protein
MLCTENKERVRENRDTRTRDVRTEKRRCIERREESESVKYFGTNMMIPGMLSILERREYPICDSSNKSLNISQT